MVSPSDFFAEIERKAFSWLDAGTEIVLILEPESKTAHVYRSQTKITVFGMGETVDASDVVIGWKVDVSEIFQR